MKKEFLDLFPKGQNNLPFSGDIYFNGAISAPALFHKLVNTNYIIQNHLNTDVFYDYDFLDEEGFKIIVGDFFFSEKHKTGIGAGLSGRFFYISATEESFNFLKLVNKKFPPKPKVNECYFNVIVSGQNGLSYRSVASKIKDIKDNRLDLYYGNSYPEQRIGKFFEEETPSLMLLYGFPGTGKTNLIKYLAGKSKKNLFFLPSHLVSCLSNPDFITFALDKLNNSILLLEDCEDALSKNRNAATNNLLQLCDGFLKDALNAKVICTFNQPITDIDPALRRKGRMYLEYEFKKLKQNEAENLVDYLNLDVNITGEMSLAEIFNQENNTENKEERKIGFTP